MAQKPYTKEIIEVKIKAINASIDEIIHRGGVIYDSALYAYLNAAQVAIVNAAAHVKEFNDEYELIHVQQNP